MTAVNHAALVPIPRMGRLKGEAGALF